MHIAVAASGHLAGAVFGSDHDRQYTSSNFPARCRKIGARQPIAGMKC